MKIAWMYPDTLFLHGERGNVLALERFAKKLGAEPSIEKVDFETENFDPMSYDMIYFGAGEISSFPALVSDVESYKDGLKAFIEAGRPLIVTGTTMAMFGTQLIREDGSVIECAGFFPAVTREREYVYGDDLYIETGYHGRQMEIVGEQIQMADISFKESDEYTGFGKIVYGMGNNGTDGIEGVMHKNSVFTNLLGPVLVCNPWLTTELIRAAAEISGERISEDDPDFGLELRSLEKKKAFIANKKPGAMGR